MTPTAPFDTARNHFELFGLPVRFELPPAAVERTYRAIQAQVHPDRFADASDAERRVSMQWATRVNEAYQTLKNPLARARYLLELAGVDAQADTNTAMPADFLMAQIAWRETAEEARSNRDVAALERLLVELREAARTLYGDLERHLDARHDYGPAAAAVRKLMFLEKLQSDIGDSISGIED